MTCVICNQKKEQIITMKGNDFRFGKPIHICGKEYWLDVNTKDKQARIRMILAKIKGAERQEDTPEKARIMIEQVKEMLDLALGDGAFGEIFEGRDIVISDLVAVLNFIRDELEN